MFRVGAEDFLHKHTSSARELFATANPSFGGSVKSYLLFGSRWQVQLILFSLGVSLKAC